MINSALRMFLRELVDPENLLPPAALSMEQSLAEYLHDRDSPESWLLGRFVVPASRLHQLARHEMLREIRMVSEGQPLPVSVVFDSVDSREDYATVAQYVYGAQQPIAIRSLDVRIVKIADVDAASRVRAVVQKLAANEIPYTIPVFLEMPYDAQTLVGDLLDAIARERDGGRTMLCAKIRCSGPTTNSVVDASDIALFIAAARKHGIPIKAGGGLSAPIYHRDEASGLVQHGLLNVIGAAILASAHDLDAQLLTQMIADGKAEDFRLDQDIFAWKEHWVDKMQIFNARMALIRGFTSARFRDQADALISLGILQTLAS